MSIENEIRSGMILNRIEGLGPIRLHQLIRAFGSAYDAIKSGATSWAPHIGDEDYCIRVGAELSRLGKETDAELIQCDKQGIQILSLTAGNYPPLLREIKVPPPILYIKGQVDISLADAMAIVGSRRCSYYGTRVAQLFANELSVAGMMTVSGLARGIDSAVHDETLKVGGITVAVIGCGLDECYPPENKNLFDRIVSEGAVISEFPLGTKPLRGNFPRRNRIIAGMTWGTVVVEGTLRSGSLITAKIAAHEGRDVFAVPGQVSSIMSEAPHMLIRQGAVLARNAADVIDALPAEVQSRVRKLPEMILSLGGRTSGPAEDILRHLEAESLSREELLNRVSLPADKVAEILVYLELEGRIKTLPGGGLVRA